MGPGADACSNAAALSEAIRAAGLNPDWVKEDLYAVISATLLMCIQSGGLLPLPNCFEVFGFDFLLDARGCVFLLEANADPSWALAMGADPEHSRSLLEGVVQLAGTGATEVVLISCSLGCSSTRSMAECHHVVVILFNSLLIITQDARRLGACRLLESPLYPTPDAALHSEVKLFLGEPLHFNFFFVERRLFKNNCRPGLVLDLNLLFLQLDVLCI